jgi:hypothetical protein
MASGIKIEIAVVVVIGVVALIVGYMFGKRNISEQFADYSTCNRCRNPRPCGCPVKPACPTPPSACPTREPCAPCAEPDPSKWVLKASVPPCPPMPDMSKYMLKTECPPHPDMSKYVLKSSVPNCPPCISTCSKPCKIGECPPCPRPRCPVVKCPEPRSCPACPASICAPCPEPDIKCKAAYLPNSPVRPMLASTSTFGF